MQFVGFVFLKSNRVSSVISKDAYFHLKYKIKINLFTFTQENFVGFFTA